MIPEILASSPNFSLETVEGGYSIWLNNRSPVVILEYREINRHLEMFGGVRGVGLNRVFSNRDTAEKAWTYLLLRWS